MIEPLADLTVQRAITEALVVDNKGEEEKMVFIFNVYNYYMFNFCVFNHSSLLKINREIFAINTFLSASINFIIFFLLSLFIIFIFLYF